MVVNCTQLARAGIEITDYRTLSIRNRYLVPNNGLMSVYVETGAEATKLTIAIPQTIDDQSVEPRVVKIPPHSLFGLGDWPTQIYNDAKSQVALRFSSVSGVRLFCTCVS